MFRFRVFVSECDSVWRRRIRRFLSLEPGCELIGECATAADAAVAIARLRPDIALLGGQTPENLLRRIPGPLPVIITISEHGDVEFKLTKPFNILRFREMLDRAKARLARDRLTELYQSSSSGPRSPDRIAVRGNGRVVFVRVTDIDWIEAADNYVCLHCGRVTHMVRETMKDLEARLDRAQFPRVHRSAIVNLDRVRELQPWFRGDSRLVLQDGTALTIAKSHRAKLESLLLSGTPATKSA